MQKLYFNCITFQTIDFNILKWSFVLFILWALLLLLIWVMICFANSSIQALMFYNHTLHYGIQLLLPLFPILHISFSNGSLVIASNWAYRRVATLDITTYHCIECQHVALLLLLSTFSMSLLVFRNIAIHFLTQI